MNVADIAPVGAAYTGLLTANGGTGSFVATSTNNYGFTFENDISKYGFMFNYSGVPSTGYSPFALANNFSSGSFQYRSAHNVFSTACSGAIQLTQLRDTTDYGTLPAVPEPTIYAMILAGIGPVGFVARRRRNLGRSMKAIKNTLLPALVALGSVGFFTSAHAYSFEVTYGVSGGACAALGPTAVTDLSPAARPGFSISNTPRVGKRGQAFGYRTTGRGYAVVTLN